MIVDVLRNDLGRVCVPGTVRVPRLCRLERTAAVQHLVSTVTGRLRAGPGPVRRPRGVVPGRLDHGRAEDPGDGDPARARAGPARAVHGRSRLDRAGRRDGDVDPHPDARRGRRAGSRSTSAAGSRGAATRRPNGTRPSPRRGSARGDRRRARSATRERDRRPARATSGSTGGSCPPTVRTSRRSIAASSWATASSRPFAPAAAGRPSCASTRAASAVGQRAWRSRCPTGAGRRPSSGDRRPARRRGPGGPEATRASGSRCRAVRSSDAASCRRTSTSAATVAVQVWPVTPPPAGHLEDGIGLVASSVRRDPANPLGGPQDHQSAPTTSSPASRPAAPAPTMPCSSPSTDTSPRRLSANCLPSSATAGAGHAGARVRDPRRDDARRGSWAGARPSGLCPEGWLTPDDLASRRRGVRVELVGRRRAARDPLGGRADRDGPARSVDAPCARRS